MLIEIRTVRQEKRHIYGHYSYYGNSTTILESFVQRPLFLLFSP